MPLKRAGILPKRSTRIVVVSGALVSTKIPSDHLTYPPLQSGAQAVEAKNP